MTELAPSTLAELVAAVRSTPRVIAVGGRTKPRLFAETNAAQLSLQGLSGITEYDPSEFTFTALAGTPVRVIAAALAERGQYLPSDPLLVDAGATLGGTVASGLSGPGRFRYGGLRDFILGVCFVDGMGRLLRMGGKVVKNAAGFDLPKFFVGSLGRFGVFAELTFKVFPRVPSLLTVRLPYAKPSDAVEMISTASSSRWELDALDVVPDESAIYARLGGPAPAAEALATEVLTRFPSEGTKLTHEEAEAFWSGIREFKWSHEHGPLVKVPLTPKLLPEFVAVASAFDESRAHVTAGGAAAFLSLPEANPGLSEELRARGLRGLTLRGDAPLWVGSQAQAQVHSAVKSALDPSGRFPSLDS